MIRLLTIFIIFSSSVFAGWDVHYIPEIREDHYYSPEKVSMTYSEHNSGYGSLSDALTAIKAQGKLDKLDFLRPYSLTESADFQNELKAAFKELAPKEWAEAEKSAETMHNPKISPMWKYLDKAFMHTSLAKKLSEDLEPFGLVFTEFGHEKLRRESVNGENIIRGIFCISITPKQEAEQAGTGQPATRSESKSKGSDKHQPEAEGRSR